VGGGGGGGGGGWGFAGMKDVLAVEFDMFANSDMGDPNGMHVAVHVPGVNKTSTSDSRTRIGFYTYLRCVCVCDCVCVCVCVCARMHACMTPTPRETGRNLQDGLPHRARIVYTQGLTYDPGEQAAHETPNIKTLNHQQQNPQPPTAKPSTPNCKTLNPPPGQQPQWKASAHLSKFIKADGMGTLRVFIDDFQVCVRVCVCMCVCMSVCMSVCCCVFGSVRPRFPLSCSSPTPPPLQLAVINLPISLKCVSRTFPHCIIVTLCSPAVFL